MQGVCSMSDFNTSAAPTSETRRLAWRLSIWAGIIGPILYTLVFTLDGAFRPGYSAINVAVSFLLLGSNGWIEIENYIVLGLLLIGNQFRKIAGWRIHGWYSMITGLPTSLAALGSLIGLFSPALPPSSGGLFERILIVIDFA